MSLSERELCNYTDDQWVDLLKAEAIAQTQKEKADGRKVVDCLWQELFTFCVNKSASYGQGEQFATDAATEAYRRIRRAVALDQYLGDCAFLPYCYVIASRCIKTLLRKTLKREAREGPLSDDIKRDMPELRFNPMKVRQLLQPCLDQLTSRERERLLLRYPWLTGDTIVEERSPQEVADLLTKPNGPEVTANAVTQAIFVARSKLKECLEKRRFKGAQDVLDSAL